MAITIAVNKVSDNISISTDDVVISTAEVVQPITVNTAIPSVVFDASYLAVTPSGLVTATNVQGAIDELAAVTEVNDLTTSVTWADVPDANITESSVVQYITSANVSAAGAAMLTGADFTGDVTITNGELTVNGSAEAELFKGDIEGAVHFKGATNGDSLTKGDVVYVSGYAGGKTVVGLADASDSSKMPAFGIVAADPVGVNVDVVTFGTLKSIDTSTYTDGDELYVDTTAGGLTATAPSGEGNLVQKIAKVVKAHNSGNIKVMGAGRTNATPNLNDGNIFIGDSNNLATTASFATEVTNATTGKADLSGATFTGDVNIADDQRLRFGDSDLQIFHKSDNNSSYIREQGTGSLFIQGENLSLTDTSGAHYLFGVSGGFVKLYHDGLERLDTKSTGIGVTGDITLTGTVDGVDIATLGANAIVDSDFTSAGLMATDGSGGYSVDSSTYATETYVDTAVSNLVDSAPTTLDTLNELASALGDDANFSTTVSNSIGTKWTEDATKIDNWDTAYSWGDHNTEGYLTSEANDLLTSVTWADVPDTNITQSSVTQHQAALSITESQISDLGTYLTASDISGKANLSGASFTGNVNIGIPPTGTQSLLVAGATTLYGGVNGGLDVTGDITVTGTVDGVDIATTIVDGDFTANGFMKRTGAGTYTVDTSSYVSSNGGTFNGSVTVLGTPPSGQGILTAHFLKGNTTTGGATTPVIDLEKNVTGMNGSGRFIEFNTKHHSTSSIVTRGHLGINQSSANGTANPYFSHNDGNCGLALTYSGSSSFNSIVPASTLGGVTSSNINLGHQYARWNGIYLKISPNVSSDIEYKRDIEELSEAEKRVAVACKGLIRKYRMRDAYEEKGESARLHIGIIAQDLQDAFTAEGLDAHRYGMFCSDTWHQATVTTEDEDGNVTTSVEDFELVEHAPEGATNITEITRLSVRYEELLAFIISTT